MQNNKNERKRRKFIIILLLFAVVGVISGGMYSYWAGSIQNPTSILKSDTNILIGEGKNVDTVLNLTDTLNDANKVLVPTGKIAASKVLTGKQNVDSFTYTYNVKWKEVVAAGGTSVLTGANEKRKLKVTATPKITGAAAGNYSLINVEIVPSPLPELTINSANSTEVKIKVTLSEPSSKEVYDDIINKPINIDLKFELETATTP